MELKNRLQKGFTLIELLVVIAIIAILAVLVFVALNPAARFQDARNSRRVNDVNNYLTGIHECIVDNAGSLTPCIGTLTANETYEIVNTGISAACDDVCDATSTSQVTDDDNCAVLDTTLAAYLKTLPVDPGVVTTDHTEYTISRDSNNIITIAACSSEGGDTIQV